MAPKRSTVTSNAREVMTVLLSVVALLASDSIRRALDTTKAENWNAIDFDSYMPTIDVGDGQIGMPPDKVPEELLPLLALLDDVWSTQFGRLHDARLLHSLDLDRS